MRFYVRFHATRALVCAVCGRYSGRMATPYQLPSGAWRAHSSLGGRRENATFATHAEAAAWIAERNVARLDGRVVHRAPRRRGGLTVRDFYTEWWPTRDNDVDLARSTRANYVGYWRNHIEPRWGQARLRQVSTHKLDAWVRDMAADGVGPETIRGAVVHLGSMLAAAVKAGHLPSNPRAGMSRLPTVPPARRSVAPPDALAAILAASKGQYRVMWQLMAESGLRWGEVAGLRAWSLRLADAERATVEVRSVVLRDGTVRDYPKSKRARVVPITVDCAERLRELALGADPGALVFTADNGGPLDYHNVYHREWLPACEAAGVKLTMHELRHTAITAWLDDGVGAHIVRDLVGHADLRMVSRYSHMTGEAFDRARQVSAARAAARA